MGDSLDVELAALRARAYGPDADIHLDADAVARLRELEAQQRAERMAPPPRPSTPESVPASVSGSIPERPPLPPSVPLTPAPAGTTGGGALSPASPETKTPQGAGPRAAEPREDAAATSSTSSTRSARIRLLRACALTALATAAVAVPITVWASGAADRPYAVLTPTVGQPNNVFFSPESNPQRYEDFLGIEISVGELDYMQGERCILIELTPEQSRDDDIQNTRGSCSPPGFGAVVDVPAVDGYLSDQVREELGDITALRFVVAGDEVHVYVARVPQPTGVDDQS